jgi:hypothetical protein
VNLRDYATQRLAALEKERESIYRKSFDQIDFEAAMKIEAEILDARGALFAGTTYTADGGTADRFGWCSCADAATQRQTDDVDVYYEAFDDAGQRTAHGYVCVSCRKITQVG